MSTRVATTLRATLRTSRRSAVDPTNGSKMTIGWRQFNSVTSNFRQAGWGYTTNGGTSWTFPGVLENNVFRSDPVLDSDDTGPFSISACSRHSLITCGAHSTAACPGRTSRPPRVATSSGSRSITRTAPDTDSNISAGARAGTILAAGNSRRSTDGGVTWLNPVNIPNSPSWGTLDVDTNGNLFIGGVNLSTGQIWCDRSSNAKDGAATPSFRPKHDGQPGWRHRFRRADQSGRTEPGRFSWRWTVPAPARITMFT